MLVIAGDPVLNARYMSAAGAAIFFYDIFITLDLEIEYIWKRLSFDAVTVAYLTSRYLSLGFFFVIVYVLSGFHGDLSDTFCKIPFDCVGYTLSYIAWTCIMTLRVCALWSQKRWLVKLIRTLWICVTCIIIVVASFAYDEVRDPLHYKPSVGICTPSTKPPRQIFKATPITPAIYELFLTILTIIKVLDYSSMSSLPILYRVLARDGVFYFAVSTLILSMNILSWYAIGNSQVNLLLSLNWAIVSVMMSRMVLNLRAAHHRSIVEQTGTDSISPSIIFRSASYSGLEGHETQSSSAERGLDLDANDLQLEVNGEAWNFRFFQSSQPRAPSYDTRDSRRHSVVRRSLSPA